VKVAHDHGITDRAHGTKMRAVQDNAEQQRDKTCAAQDFPLKLKELSGVHGLA
jgi:hypothetical protein